MVTVKNLPALVCLFMLASAAVVHPCTGFYVYADGRWLFANNEDWYDMNPFLAFYPARGNDHGRLQFEYAWPLPEYPGYITDFGGMNDAGLAFDEFAHADAPLMTTMERPEYRAELTQKCLRECATVEEALAVHARYDLSVLRDHQTMFLDPAGASAIIEGDEIIEKDGDYQICTNFLQSRYRGRIIEDYRYNLVHDRLVSAGTIDMDLLASILEETHNPGPGYWTQYSYITDPAAGTLRLYHFHNFQEYLDIDLRKELARGERHFHLPSLFSNIRIESPSAGAVVEGTAVTFSWMGYKADYTLSCSTDKDFKDCRTVSVSRQAASNAPLAVLASAVPLALLLLRRRRTFAILIALAMLLSLASCSHAPSRLPNEEPRVFTRTVSDLQAGQTYYWRILAERTKGFVTVCEGGTFRTAE